MFFSATQDFLKSVGSTLLLLIGNSIFAAAAAAVDRLPCLPRGWIFRTRNGCLPPLGQLVEIHVVSRGRHRNAAVGRLGGAHRHGRHSAAVLSLLIIFVVVDPSAPCFCAGDETTKRTPKSSR